MAARLSRGGGDRVLPRIDAFAPDLIVISAGFDAHWRDPLASLNLTRIGFRLGDPAADGARRRHCGRRSSPCSKVATTSKGYPNPSPSISMR